MLALLLSSMQFSHSMNGDCIRPVPNTESLLRRQSFNRYPFFSCVGPQQALDKIITLPCIPSHCGAYVPTSVQLTALTTIYLAGHCLSALDKLRRRNSPSCAGHSTSALYADLQS